MKDLSEKSWDVPQIMKLLNPHWKNCFGPYFLYPRSWLLYAVACEQFLHPDAFDLDRILTTVQHRLDDTAL